MDAFLAAVGGEKIAVPCKGPYMEDVQGFYGRLPGGAAVVEMAAAAGLPLAGDRLHAEQTTTCGVGQLILAALEGGAKKLIVGLGGSATNDGGAGMLAALGVRFLRRDGTPYLPVWRRPWASVFSGQTVSRTSQQAARWTSLTGWT